MTRERSLAACLVSMLWVCQALAGPVDDPVNTGPSSSHTPYLLPVLPGARSAAILTTGDAVPDAANPGTSYRMAGIPDGLGAFDNGDGTITILMNHEIGAEAGSPRGHGAPGAFVSRWVVDKKTLKVVSGRDFVANPADLHIVSGPRALARLCSADLAPAAAFFNPVTGKGYDGRIFLNGEESRGVHQRAFAWVVAENAAYQLPAFGNAPWENWLASPHTGDKTVVIGNADMAGGKIWVYVGDKQTTGSSIEKAGLTNGTVAVVKAAGVAAEDRDTNIGLTKTLPAAGPGVRFTLDPDTAAGGTGFQRPEDGAWDTKDPNRYYFVTTDRYDQVKDKAGPAIGRSRLWALTFDDVKTPAAGGKIELLLDGTEPHQMLDNIAVDAQGRIYLLEDVGAEAHNGKVWLYDPSNGAMTQLFMHDPARFGDVGVAPMAPFNNDEESSGIIDATDLFRDSGWYQGGQVFLIVVQAHYALPAPLVEGGQLLLLTVP